MVEGEKKPPSEVVVAVSQPFQFGSDPNQRRLRVWVWRKSGKREVDA